MSLPANTTDPVAAWVLEKFDPQTIYLRVRLEDGTEQIRKYEMWLLIISQDIYHVTAFVHEKDTTKSSFNLQTGPDSGFFYASVGAASKVFRCKRDSPELQDFQTGHYKRTQEWLWMGPVSDVAPGEF